MSAISELSTIHRAKAKTPEEKRLLAKEAGRDNKAGYLFLLPWLIGLVLIIGGARSCSFVLSISAALADRTRADHRRADDCLVVPVVYQLQPDPGAQLGRAG